MKNIARIVKVPFRISLGIATEIMYAFFIMLAGLVICFIMSCFSL